MKRNAHRIVILVVLAITFIAFVMREKIKTTGSAPPPPAAEEENAIDSSSQVQKIGNSEKKLSTPSSIKENSKTKSEATQKLPCLVDLGAGKCIPCKMMAPILEELKKEYEGRLKVEVIDVSENPSAANAYRIRVVPTQIFFDPSGREIFRHEGFISKEDILARWKSLGFDLEKGAVK